jgi:hypothetical protein
MEPYLESGYVKMCRKRKKTHVAYMDKMGKQSKLLQTITFSSELIFEKKIVTGKVLRRRRHISTHNFELGTKILSESNKVIFLAVKT